MTNTNEALGCSLMMVLVGGVLGCGGGGEGGYVPAHVASARPEPAAANGQRMRETEYELEAAPSAGAPRPAADMMAQGYVPNAAMAAPLARPPEAQPAFNTEQYHAIEENDFRLAREQPLSTFSVDVDTASYSNVRRFLSMGQRPPIDAVRVEELINYFSYDQPRAWADSPMAVDAELAQSPFDPQRALVRVGLRASAPESSAAPAKRFVFLVDASGSMQDANKLPLLQQSLALLVPQLTARDRVALVTYAGNSGVVLEPTRGDRHEEIMAAVGNLSAGGSTNGASGIELAYQLAQSECHRGDNCRVLLATDGDFNVGVTDEGSLVKLIERERDAGVFLTVLGFGIGNLHDGTMELLADKGDGSYAYIDTLREARKVLVEQAGATLRTVAKDTKIQVEWNPARVERYRLIGYENRNLHDEDFNDDHKDAGDMGDGAAVTALYEIELRGSGSAAKPRVDPLKYQAARAATPAADSDELMTVKERYKTPGTAESKLLSTVVRGSPAAFAQASSDLRFAAAVAGFGMLLRESPFAGKLRYEDVASIAGAALGSDRDGYRHEFLELVGSAQRVAPLHAD
jgi:Ca-activated chloride channel family protein